MTISITNKLKVGQYWCTYYLHAQIRFDQNIFSCYTSFNAGHIGHTCFCYTTGNHGRAKQIPLQLQ